MEDARLGLIRRVPLMKVYDRKDARLGRHGLTCT